MADRFVSEKEIEEAKAKRQAEWEKVRKEDDPELPPEEPVDNRPLYERLREQKDKIQLEKDEAKQFKNQFRGLDNEEVIFLDVVDDLKEKEIKKRKSEEKNLIEEMKKVHEQEELHLPSTSLIVPPPIKKSKPDTPKVSKQAALLGVAIKRKSTSDQDVKSNNEDKSISSPPPDKKHVPNVANNASTVQVTSNPLPSASYVSGLRPTATVTKTAIPSALVGYGGYSSDSSVESDDDSNSDHSEHEAIQANGVNGTDTDSCAKKTKSTTCEQK